AQLTVVDGRVVSTFFRLVFGKESICSPTPISDLEPFNDQALKYIEICQGARVAICKGEFSSYCFMHKPSDTVLDIFLTACKNACEQKSVGKRNAIENKDHSLIEPTASPTGKKDKERALTHSSSKNFPVGGAPKAAITEVVEWAYDKLSKSGNTEIIKPGKIRAFLQYLKECITEGNANYSEYVAKRIIEIKAVDGACKITMQDLTSKEKLRMLNAGKHTIISKNRVSTILSELRKNEKS
ncbi:MAG: hypothetical protein Q7W05_08145, partial [Deltaproteobacteria bacterium]|nr:hypothetical protein [Deltaproteobacteria bacterium]